MKAVLSCNGFSYFKKKKEHLQANPAFITGFREPSQNFSSFGQLLFFGAHITN
jgi:hypothetical protein